MKLKEVRIPAGVNFNLGDIAVTDMASAELHGLVPEPTIFRKGDGIDIHIRFREVGHVHVTWERSDAD